MTDILDETPGRAMLRLKSEAALRAIADAIKARLAPGFGFALFSFEYGEGGSMAYVSTASREDVIDSIEEWKANTAGKRKPNVQAARGAALGALREYAKAIKSGNACAHLAKLEEAARYLAEVEGATP